MRAMTTMLAGLVMIGLTGAAEAKKNQDDDKGIPECGKHTKVVKSDDGIITLKEKKKRGCIIDVTALHPTQSAVGMDAVECKAEKITGKAKEAGKLGKYLLSDDRWVPLVRGPGGVFYLTDHHHLSTAMLNADIKDKEKRVYAYLINDWSKLSDDEFWTRMVKEHDTWLKLSLIHI